MSETVVVFVLIIRLYSVTGFIPRLLFVVPTLAYLARFFSCMRKHMFCLFFLPAILT